MRTRRGSLLNGTIQGNAILTYKPGDIVKSVLIPDPFFTGIVQDVDTKTNKVLVSWGNGPVSQFDVDEIMHVPFSLDAGINKTASRRMRADDVSDLVEAPEIGIEIADNAPDSETQTDFVPNDMEGLLNRQVGAEFYSAYLYYMISAICQSKGLVGFQNWFENQGDGEIDHAMKVFNYLVSTGSNVDLPNIPGPDLDAGLDIAEITRLVLDHEMGVTQDWKRIGQLAKIQDNPATCKLVQDFLDEQIEEEDAALTLHQRVGLADSGSGILLIDNDLKDRSPIAVTASNTEDLVAIIEKAADTLEDKLRSILGIRPSFTSKLQRSYLELESELGNKDIGVFASVFKRVYVKARIYFSPVSDGSLYTDIDLEWESNTGGTNGFSIATAWLDPTTGTWKIRKGI